jgi:demethylmenaquinone methyltransferase / 2-methoxy-6-polyprenyl-1,4-benzoquinol methylase
VQHAVSERNRAARRLFAPIAESYDRYARLLSLAQDPRWRSFLVSRITARPDDTVLDVASGTGAVAIELVRRYGCRVVGIDQSAEMLAAGRARVEAAGLAERIDLREGRAESLPLPDRTVDGLTCTYLLRYVNDPRAAIAQLARVVRPGGRLAMLDFYVPPGALPRAAWEAYVRALLPAAGRVISPGWHDVGRFLGPSIRAFWAANPLPDVLDHWRAAGVEDVRAQTLSLGGGVVVWGTRGE